MIEKDFDVSFIADLALHEKQIQQNYRPIIAVHKWFARRPGTLFRGLLLSEFVSGKLRETYYESHDLQGIKVVDPFMGGGTPLVEANRLGCNIIGYDINPVSYWIVHQEIEHIDLQAYRIAADRVISQLQDKIGKYYFTTCLECASPTAYVKYFIWVKTHCCTYCQMTFDLFPNYLLAENRRHPQNVLICSTCGELNEASDRYNPGNCHSCGGKLLLKGPASRRKCQCPSCGQINSYPEQTGGAPQHRLVAIEYFCPECKSHHRGRFFKKPDSVDLAKYDGAASRFSMIDPDYVPDNEIPPGDETKRLHRWGYRKYREMFNDRQLLGLELSCQLITQLADGPVRNALITNLSDLLRYQNMLCRYDSMALKSLDIFSIHGFPVGLIQCESNLLGIVNNGVNIGSGGWTNIIDKYARAKSYCDEPFEVKHQNKRRYQIQIKNEWIGEKRTVSGQVVKREVELNCCSATTAALPPASLDAVITDPPYLGNVQYAELMDFCYVWLRKLANSTDPAFAKPTTRDEQELTANSTMERGLVHFTEGLATVFTNMARALKPGGPMAFTYHHNTIEAYLPVIIAILDAGLVCSATIPCPAEMGASIHINGTGSSIIDTVFICRSTGLVSRHTIVTTPTEVAGLVQLDCDHLSAGGVKLSQGDLRCITFGHLTRLAIWNLRGNWNKELPIPDKLQIAFEAVNGLGGWPEVKQHLGEQLASVSRYQQWEAREDPGEYRGEAVSI